MLGSQVSVRFARDLRPNDFKTGDVILLGASEADPWVELYEPRLNFLFRDDYKGVFSILNRNPQKGEPARWECRWDDPQRRVFGVWSPICRLLPGTAMHSSWKAQGCPVPRPKWTSFWTIYSCCRS